MELPNEFIFVYEDDFTKIDNPDNVAMYKLFNPYEYKLNIDFMQLPG